MSALFHITPKTPWTIRLLACLLVLSAGCSGGVDITDAGGGFVGAKKKGDDLNFGDESRQRGGTDEGDDDQEDFGENDPEVEYPGFKFTGNGAATCNGGSGPTTSAFMTSITADTMVLQSTRAHMECGSIDKCKADKANEEISQSIATNTYTRVRDDQLDEFEKAGDFTWGRYAVFASGVDHKKQNGNEPSQYSFSKPLPVFPFPAPASRFKALAGTGKSWTATATGSFTMTVTVTMVVVNASDTSILVKMTTTIAEDRDRSLYEAFPMPREATYLIDPVKRQITRVDVLNWFLGNKCDDRQEQVTMAYDVCEKSLRGTIENFRSCDN